jgi:hypothetical protein
MRHQNRRHVPEGAIIPTNPFTAESVPFPPLLPGNLRAEETVEVQAPEPNEQQLPPIVETRSQGVLVWRKTLRPTDALQVKVGSNPVGGVLLVQAKFRYPSGQRIDQTTYFRQLFDDYHWENEPGRYSDQEHTFIPIRIFIRGRDYGIRNFEISYKPSGEAGQRNYTTILRWGRDFTPIVLQENLTGTVFSLYETDEENASFLIDITNA